MLAGLTGSFEICSLPGIRMTGFGGRLYCWRTWTSVEIASLYICSVKDICRVYIILYLARCDIF